MWTSADDSMKAAFDKSRFDANNNAVYGMDIRTKYIYNNIAQVVIPAYMESVRESLFPRHDNTTEITPVYVIQLKEIDLHYEGGNSDYDFNYGYSARKDVDKDTPIECIARYSIRQVELYRGDDNDVIVRNTSYGQTLADYLQGLSFTYNDEKVTCSTKYEVLLLENYIEFNIKLDKYNNNDTM